MKINVNRMAVLAGISSSSRQGRLNESAHSHGHKLESEEHIETMDEADLDAMIKAMPDKQNEDDIEEDDQMIEIDEVMLVQELRRAKKMMLESKKVASRKSLQESKLQKIIEEEVQNIFSELDLNTTGGWVYGNNRPQRSKKGYVHQGSYLKGLGFK